MKKISNRSNNGKLYMDKFCYEFDMNNHKHTPLGSLVVSQRKKTIFIHIAKSGGSSIANWLKENDFDDGIIDDRSVRYEKKKAYFSEVCEEISNYCIFTSFRNMTDLLQSLFFFDRFPCENNLLRSYAFLGFPGLAFQNFLRNKLGRTTQYGYLIDPYWWCTSNGKILVDYVVDFENLQSSFQDFASEALKINKSVLPYSNKGRLRRMWFQRNLNVTMDQQRKINELFPFSSNNFDDFCEKLSQKK